MFGNSTDRGTSFLSIHNGPLEPDDFTWAMELRYVNEGRAVPDRFLG